MIKLAITDQKCLWIQNIPNFTLTQGMLFDVYTEMIPVLARYIRMAKDIEGPARGGE